jgi:predicted membrane-bound spermidine synthase
LVYTNGNVPTNMVRWNGDLSRITPILRYYPLMDWSFASAPLGNGSARQGRVLSIGPGGGLDALMALHYGAQDFEGAEINPSIVGLMRDYRQFNGGIYERPDVHVVTAEGRAYVREAELAGKRYSLIYSALTKTATAGQGMALLESYIYTQNAYRDYWNALDKNGQMVQVCDQAFLLARLFATAVAMLQEQGMSEAEAGKHIVLAADQQPGPYRFALVVQKTPFTSQQTFAMSNEGLRRGLIMLWLPGREAVSDLGPFPALASGQMSLPQFVNWWRTSPQLPQAIDVSPCDDNRPFVLDPNVGQLAVMWQLAAVAALLALGLAAFGWRTSRIDAAESTEATQRVLASDSSLPSRVLPLLYFSLLGVGFMLVEIPLAQKIILPLGYPTLALTTILFSILLGGGIGAWFSQRVQNMAALRRYAALCALGVALVTVGGTLVLNQVSDSLLALPLTTRCLLVGAALLPLGFLLGTPFPAGMRLVSQREASNIPLIWGLNGVASVVGSLCAAMFAKAWGFNTVLFIGAATYAVAAAVLLVLGRDIPQSALVRETPSTRSRL